MNLIERTTGFGFDYKLNFQALEEALITEAPLCVDAEGKLLSADILANTLKACALFEKFTKEFKKQLMEQMISLGCDLRVPGTPRDWLTLKETAGRESISAIKAGPTLREWFTLEECDRFVSIAKGEMLKVAEGKAPNGEKAATSKKLMEELREAGAVTQGQPSFSVAVMAKDVDR